MGYGNGRGSDGEIQEKIMTIAELAEKNVKDFVWPQLVKDEKPRKMIVVGSCSECLAWHDCSVPPAQRAMYPYEIHSGCPLEDYPDGGNL